MREGVAEGFYPGDSKELSKTVDGLLKSAKSKVSENIVGAVVPHAGYTYSGPVAAEVYKALPKADVVVILGTNHTGVGERVAVSDDDWETPLGVVECAQDVASEIVKNSTQAKFDELAHMYEHSIEVQLPFLQKVMPGFKLVAVAVSSELNGNGFLDVGNAVASAIEGKNAIVIASSDFTHFGNMYGFAPVETKQVEWVTKTDSEIIDAIIGLRADDAVSLSRQTTVCGAGAIASLIAAVDGSRGRILKYATSYDVSKSKDAIVGYAGIVFEK